MGKVCSSNHKAAVSDPNDLEQKLKKHCLEIKVSVEKEIISKNVEKENKIIELAKLVKLSPRSPVQEKEAATQIVYLQETRETFDHINFIVETIIQQSHLIALYHEDADKISTFNPSFQFLFWINGKIRNEKLELFIKYINASPCFSKEMKGIYTSDDLIPSKTKKLFEQYLPDPGLVAQFLDTYYAKNNIQNVRNL